MLTSSDACERNKGPILAVLERRFAHCTRVLEVGSGTGQHAVYFAAQMPHLQWQPTEQVASIAHLAERIRVEGSTNVQAPLVLDVNQPEWPIVAADAMFTANTLHIMSWEQVQALVRGAVRILKTGGLLAVYGPFRYGGEFTSPSNAKFDHMLRARDGLSGIRDLEAVSALGAEEGLVLNQDYDLPAFNRLLIFLKQPSAPSRL